MALPVSPPLAPMLAKLERTLPTGDYSYEPKWDGFRALAFRDGADVDLRSRNDRQLARYFPEVVDALRSVDEPRFVLDGEIVVTSRAGLDFAALMGRLHPAASRIERLRRETPATFVAFDLVAVADQDLRAAPFRERRARLEALVGAPRPHLLVTPSTNRIELAARWLETMSGAGVDGVVAKLARVGYEPGRRAMVKIKREHTLDCVVAGVRLFAGEPVLGALLLGLYASFEQGSPRLVHVGVASQFTSARRRELARELGPLVTSIHGHPWEHGFNLPRSPLGRLAGSAGRWSPDEMARDWLPVRPERVAEVRYDTIDGFRLRYPARFARWRPDRDPSSCTVDQIEEARGDVLALIAS